MIRVLKENIIQLKSIARTVCRQAIKMVGQAVTGHIGGSLSCCDVLVALYFNVLNIEPSEPNRPDRDRLVLWKGRATPATETMVKRVYKMQGWDERKIPKPETLKKLGLKKVGL